MKYLRIIISRGILSIVGWFRDFSIWKSWEKRKIIRLGRLKRSF